MISIEKLFLLVWTSRFRFRDVLRMVEGDPGLVGVEEGACSATLVVMVDTDEEGFMYGGIFLKWNWNGMECTDRTVVR